MAADHTENASAAGEQPLPRKLAAILYADVAGYSRLTGIDEEGTHRRLAEHLDLFAASVKLFNGRTVHYAGDAILAEFGTASDALSCAVSVQDELRSRDSIVAAEKRLEFRVGLNIGEVIIDRDDIYGEGVNVAARLEALADPGGICVSEVFRTAVGRRFDLAFGFLGEKRVKNIEEPLRAYRVGAPGNEPPRTQSASAEPASIAVLALDNMSGDPDQAYFSDGISEDIITDLSKLPGMTVIARNSAFAYRGRQVDVREICRQLGVAYLLEGSVRKAGERVRVNVQLIAGESGAHVWAERYDRELTDIFAVQDEICREVVAALGARLAPPAGGRPPAHVPGVDAYDNFLRGREQALMDNPQANRQARDLLEKALALDPAFSLACSHLCRNYVLSFVNRWGDDPESDRLRSLELGAHAIELDADNAHGHFALAMALLWSKRHTEALSAVRRAIAIDPNFADGHAGHALILVYLGQAGEAVEHVSEAMRLDPHYRDILLHVMALACFHDGRFKDAVQWLRRRLIRKPESDISRVLLASALGHCGELEQARTQWDALMTINPTYSLAHRRRILPYRYTAAFDEIVAGLTAAGIDADDERKPT